MPMNRGDEEKLLRKAKELTRKVKSRRLKKQFDIADWMNRPPEELAEIIRSLDPKVVKELTDAIGLDIPPEVLSQVDARTVEAIRNVVKKNT